MAKRLTSLKLASSIKVGTGEETYLSGTSFDMFLDGVVIRITPKKAGSKTVCTSMMNASYWSEAEEENAPAAKKVEAKPQVDAGEEEAPATMPRAPQPEDDLKPGRPAALQKKKPGPKGKGVGAVI